MITEELYYPDVEKTAERNDFTPLGYLETIVFKNEPYQIIGIKSGMVGSYGFCFIVIFLCGENVYYLDIPCGTCIHFNLRKKGKEAA